MKNEKESCNKICGRLCIEMEGYLASALSISSGEQEKTDSDVILDSKGNPFIPGSALAGALRAYTGEIGLEKEANQLFGKPKNERPGTESDRRSRIFVYDTPINEAQIGIRDGVRLRETKAADHQSKYEIQIIEGNATFNIRLEFIERELDKGQDSLQKLMDDDLHMMWSWVHGFSSGALRLGGRSRRGFGRLKVEKVRIKKFDMEDKDSYLEWLDWDWKKPDVFSRAECIDVEKGAENPAVKCQWEQGIRLSRGCRHCLEVPLEIPYTLLIRTYSTAFAKTEEMPDYGQLTAGGTGEKALIPGSSIAGAFRSHIAKIVKEVAHLTSWEEAQCKLNCFFGTWKQDDRKDNTKSNKKDVAADNEDKLLASRIIFEEVLVDGGHGFPIFRNAIDRFTGGTVDGALYEAVPWAGGKVLLRILWTKNRQDEEGQDSDDIICGLLLWAIFDLQAGILPIGGETAVGRGIFCSPEEKGGEIFLDGIPLNENQKDMYMQKAVHWAKEAKGHSAETGSLEKGGRG